MCLLKENGSKCYLLDLDNDLSLPKHSMHGYPRMNYIYKVLVEFPTPPPNFAGANVMNHPNQWVLFDTATYIHFSTLNKPRRI